MQYFRKKSQSGFTLIELLVVIAIIGILASTVLASLSSARKTARDSARVQAVKQLQNALEVYRVSNGSYPTTNNSWQGHDPGSATCYGDHGTGATGYIPGLVPNYISILPVDPLARTSDNHCYLYKSNGKDYKILIHYTFETCNGVNPKCPLQDPQRNDKRVGAVYTDGAKNW